MLPFNVGLNPEFNPGTENLSPYVPKRELPEVASKGSPILGDLGVLLTTLPDLLYETN